MSTFKIILIIAAALIFALMVWFLVFGSRQSKKLDTPSEKDKKRKVKKEDKALSDFPAEAQEISESKIEDKVLPVAEPVIEKPIIEKIKKEKPIKEKKIKEEKVSVEKPTKETVDTPKKEDTKIEGKSSGLVLVANTKYIIGKKNEIKPGIYKFDTVDGSKKVNLNLYGLDITYTTENELILSEGDSLTVKTPIILKV